MITDVSYSLLIIFRFPFEITLTHQMSYLRTITASRLIYLVINVQSCEMLTISVNLINCKDTDFVEMKSYQAALRLSFP